MSKLNTTIKIALFYLLLPASFAQDLLKKIQYQTEVGTFLSTSGQNSFFLHSNQYGIVPLKSQIITLRGSLHKEYDSTINSKFSYGYGLNTGINIGSTNQIIIPEAYFKVRFKAFEFYAGRRKEIFGLVDTTLTSGSYIWSGNALPLPKIQVSIPNYTSIIGKGLLSIKGGYAHGWFDNGLVKNFYLHQKWFYGRLGKPNWKMKFYAGFNHQVQWGGAPITPYIEKQTGKLITNYGNDLKTYLNVISGISLNKNGEGVDLNGVPLNEAWNRSGNHLGSIDIATEINFKNYNLFVYRQSVYEDGSLFYLNNINDGLFGVSLQRKNVATGILKICIEYLNTTSQGGATGSDNTIPQLRGQDNYFNNSIYRNSWTYSEDILGTPLLVPLNQINPNLINKYDYSTFTNTYVINNRVKGFNFSFSGKMSNIQFQTKLLWTNNLGLYGFPFSVKQFSFIQQFKYQFPKYTLISNIAIDKGQLFKNNLGCYLGIQRIFFK